MADTHTNKEVQSAVAHAMEKVWTVKRGRGSHTWGILRCPNNDKDCRCGEFCQISVWKTPRNPGNHARKIKRQIDGCIFEKEGDGE